MPIGGLETSKFLRAVGKFAGLEKNKIEGFIKNEGKKFYYYMERSADFFIEFRYDITGKSYNISDAYYALGISKFLVNELGLIPGEQYIADDTPEEYQEFIREEFKHLSKDISTEVIFEVDGGKIHEKLRHSKQDDHTKIILESSWDRDIALEVKTFLLSVSLPIVHRLIMNRSYVGYNGGLMLVEDIYGNILETYK